MDKYLKIIEKQIGHNQGKNIFQGHGLTFKFVDETVKAISNIGEIDIETEEILVGYATDKSLEEFCRMNQYYAFNSQSKKDLRTIYCDLFSVIKANRQPIDEISGHHYKNLKNWLSKTNPFAEKIYSSNTLAIKPVPCSEYSAKLQCNILKIETFMEPVLDIGCGRHANLVKHLDSLDIKAFGIDRFAVDKENIFNSDWLEFDFGVGKWGTIVSNLGFSNHFIHHHMRDDGDFMAYAKKYMEILNSLKVGGAFHYAPDVPFVELFLDNKKFQVDKHEISGFDIKTTVVRRLK
jgi:hypothetical protein